MICRLYLFRICSIQNKARSTPLSDTLLEHIKNRTVPDFMLTKNWYFYQIILDANSSLYAKSGTFSITIKF